MKERLEYVLAGRDELTRPLKRAEEQMKGLEKQAKRTGVQMNQFGGALTGAGKDLRKFAMGGLQQAGYQIGDYAVQVANGTSKMQAFGQQAPQLLQIFGPLGAVAGAAVSVFAAFAVAAEKTAQASANATPKIMEYKKALKNLSDQATATKTNLMLMISGLASMEELAIQQQIVAARKELVAAQKALNEAEGIAKVGAETRVKNAQKAVDEAERELTIEMLRVDMERNILKFANSRTAAAQKMVEQANAEVTIMSQVMPMHESIVALVQQNLKKEQEINKALQDQNRFANSRTEAAKKLNEQINAEDIVMSQIVRKSALVLEFEEKRLKIKQLIDGLKPEKEYGGRGGDPRKQTADYMNQMGYTSVDELIRQLSEKGPKAIKDTANAFKVELTPEMQRIMDVSESIGQSFENAFMSAVDGSMKAKDAFRMMAADIIKELYRVFVVKQITGFITDAASLFLGPKVGSVSMGPKAIGGPVQAGGSYLVGERGPELFRPARSGSITPNDQLGGGTIVVNQTINVSTGVQQTVRTEIKSLMPQIAESAKAAVADAKRRGGSYGRAFA